MHCQSIRKMPPDSKYEIEKNLKDIKLELKCWESMFQRKHGRKPNKDDINVTSSEIKDAYKQYSVLKMRLKEDCIPSSCTPDKVAQEPSPQPKKALMTSSVFGAHLNKSNKEERETVTCDVHLKREFSAFFVKKHANGYSRTRLKDRVRIPRSTIDECYSKQEENVLAESDNMASSLIISNQNNQFEVDVSNVDSRTSNKPMTPLISPQVNKQSFRKKVSKEWLSNCAVHNIEDELIQMTPCKKVSNDNNRITASKDDLLTTPEVSINQNDSACNKQDTCDPVAINNIPTTPLKTPTIVQLKETLNCIKNNIEQKDSEIITADVHTLSTTDSNNDYNLTDFDVSNQQSETATPLSVSSTPLETLCNDSSKPKLLGKVSSALKRSNTMDICPTARDHESAAPVQKKPRVGIARAVSENYVRLDMKKKKYQRGKSFGVNKGGAYKRQMWKDKSQFSTKATSECYKCGETGHWAKKCKNKWKKSKKLAVNENGDDEEMEDDNNFKKEPEQPFVTAAFDWDRVPELCPPWPRVPYTPDEPPLPAEPLFETVDGKPGPDAFEAVNEACQELGYQSFREGQENAVARIVCGLSTLVVLATGTGKSLCYQLPAYLYHKHRGDMTIVVSPLVALMEDQVVGLPYGLKGACLNANMSKVQKDKVIASVCSGEIAILLVSPEAMVAGGFGHGMLPSRESLPRIAFACIDEAHCVSEWSHNFRPSYLRVCQILKDRFGVHCFLGLTATATTATSQSVAEHLGVTDFSATIISGNVLPSNLRISVSRDDNRDDALVQLLSGDRFSTCTSIIVYCTRRETTNRLSALLRTQLQNLEPTPLPEIEMETSSTKKRKSKKKKSKSGPSVVPWDADCYHAGLTAAQRRRVQKNFMCGKLRIVVATVAFGMGLDKSDVRAIIHYNMPKSFENYVQEIGRAGRDGLEAHCHVFLDEEGGDLYELKRHIHSNTADPVALKRLVTLVFPDCSCDEIAAKANNNEIESVGNCVGHCVAFPIESTVQLLDLREENVATLLSYLALNKSHAWIDVLNNIKSSCSLQCYGGPAQLQLLSERNLPTRCGLGLMKKRQSKSIWATDVRSFSFNVIELSDLMNWEYVSVCRDMTSLQWNASLSLTEKYGKSGKSGITVEFNDLSFHIVTKKQLCDDERDEVLTFLAEKVLEQERKALFQIESLYSVLRNVSCKNVYRITKTSNRESEDKLRDVVTSYFRNDEKTVAEKLKSFHCWTAKSPTESRWSRIANDIRTLMFTHSEEKFSGRSLARIFHGIDSPRYPAEVWGRDRRFWRQHIDVEFNELRLFCNDEIIGAR